MAKYDRSTIFNFILGYAVVCLLVLPAPYTTGQKTSALTYIAFLFLLGFVSLKSRRTFKSKRTTPAKLLPPVNHQTDEEFHVATERFNRFSRENPEALIKYLRDAEQIPDEDESIDEFLERTGWTLKQENERRKNSGLPLIANENEFRKLFEQ